MNAQPLYRYLTMAALLGIWSCSSSRQTAQNTGEVDDLYGSSSNAVVYAGNSSSPSSVAQRPTQRYGRQQQQRFNRNTNPDYSPTDDQQGYNNNSDEYYTELSARKLNRGLSPDPGWNDGSASAYNSGFSNGYNSALSSSYGFSNPGFFGGLGLGLGLGAYGGYGYNSFGYSPFGYSPFGYNSFGYSPFGYNSFGYSPFGYGGFGSPFYSPFYSPFGFGYNSFGYGGYGYGGYGYGSPVYVVNTPVTGADRYTNNRSYGARGGSSTNAYNNGFVNTPRTTNSGGRTGAYTGSSSAPVYTNNARGNSSGNGGYYTAPNANSRGNSYYYDNGTSSSRGGRVGSGSTPATNSPAPSYSSGRSNNDYYTAPRTNSRGSYSPPTSSYGNSNARGSYSQPSYQSRQPSYQAQQPTYSAPQRTYSQPSTPTYSSPSFGGSRGGGGGGYSGGGGGGGGSRGPR